MLNSYSSAGEVLQVLLQALAGAQGGDSHLGGVPGQRVDQSHQILDGDRT